MWKNKHKWSQGNRKEEQNNGQNTCHSNSAGNSLTKYDNSCLGKGHIPECWTSETFLHKK
jgi:hypothetical protein